MVFPKRLFAALSAIVIFALPLSAQTTGHTLSPNETLRPYGAVKGWSVYASEIDGRFDGCRAVYDDASGPLGLGKTHEGWRLTVPSEKDGVYTGAILQVDDRMFDAQFGLAPSYAWKFLAPAELEAIRQGDLIQVSLGEDWPLEWLLTGSAAALLKVGECYDRAGAQPGGGAPAVIESDAARLGADCPALGAVRSAPGLTPARVQFTNRANQAVTVYWLDMEGIPQEYLGLLPGESGWIDSFAEHLWIAKDFQGTCHGGTISLIPGVSYYEIP